MNYYCFVKNGKLATPENVFVHIRQITGNPFPKPTRVGDSVVGEKSDDTFLRSIGVFRLYKKDVIQPENTVFSKTTYIITNTFVLQTDEYRPLTNDEIKENRRAELVDELDSLLAEIQPEISLRNLGLAGMMDDTEYNEKIVDIREVQTELKGLN